MSTRDKGRWREDCSNLLEVIIADVVGAREFREEKIVHAHVEAV